ncbi:diguanylate cyclase domain-containing protein [Desulfotomaculum sp. 1211_IL3151]|uniref:diguanylate cyclase domain-containing protein n=1 Tax=Desulfotomaculum sp. 1211_IL3151 TaxID=3084055 RepID=UPI002FD8D66D
MIRIFPTEVIEKILEEIRVGLTLVDTEGKVVWSNKLAEELLGWDKKGASVLNCHAPNLRDKVIHKINHCKEGKEWHRTIKIRGRFIENTYSPIQIPDFITGVMIITRNVTEREKMLKVIRKAAITDNLTGLYNRKYVEQVWSDLVLGNKPFGVIMLDVNALKYINDNHGHEAGDRLLINAANIICKSVRRTDYVFRFGGDEFLVLLPEADEETLAAIKQRIKSQNQVPTQEQPISVNLSIGICLSKEVNNAGEIIPRADQRMYLDKRQFYENEGRHLAVRNGNNR